MKSGLKVLCLPILAALALPSAKAQTQQPVLTVSLTEIDVLTGTGNVVFVDITNPGTGYIAVPNITVTNYDTPTRSAAFSATTNVGGTVSSVNILDRGQDYTIAPKLTFDPPTTQNSTTAQATAYLGSTQWITPFQNESYGPAKVPIGLTALATGTFPANGFTYEYFVNGVSIGTAVAHPPAGTPATIGWTPPQPGAYFIHVTASDGAHTAVSLPVRYFATGTMFTSPSAGSIVPAGSSVAVQATATPIPLSVVGGANYTSAPTVTFDPGTNPGSGAAATATLASGVTSIKVANGGSGYTGNPAVTISGGGGSGAAATSTILNGSVVAINMTSYGTGYTSAPTVTIAAPSTPGVTATATGVVSNYVSAVNVTSAGTGYTTAPAVVFSGGGGAGATAIASISSGGVSGVTLTASNAFVQRIDFYADGVLVGSDSTIPYSLIYTPSTNVLNHTLEAKAYDNNGNQVSADGTATLNLKTVPPIGSPPTVSITNPVNNATLAIGNDITVAVAAGSSSGLISKVELYVDGALLGTSSTFPYQFTWHPTVVGPYHLVALAYDDKSNVVASSIAPASTTVNIRAAPTVTIASPAAGSTVGVNSPVGIIASAGDSNVGESIVRVQFFADALYLGESSTPTTPTSGQYSFTWTPTSTGTVQLTALAINSLGLSASSPAVSVAVASGGGGPGGPVGQPPTAQVTYPTSSTQLPVNKPVTVTANASDPDGNIVSVQFFANTQSLGTVTTYPYSVSWTPIALGPYKLTVQATDNNGNTYQSSVVQVSVVDPTPGAPTVSVASPSNGSSVTVGTPQTLRANATDSGSVQSVQFFVNGQPQGGVITTFPFTTTWTPPTPGTYTITARAVNASGIQATSAPSVVTVSGGTAPTVTVTNPLTAATLAVNTAQSLTAAVTAGTAPIASVQFLVNGVSIGTDSTYPYTFNWTPTSPGIYTVVARATDTIGNVVDSTGNVVTVTAGSAPTVTLTSPANNSTFVYGAVVTVSANASDSDGSITQVDFLVNGASLTTKTTFPYTTSFTPPSPGTYTITARATDNAGNMTDATATVTVLAGSGPVVELINPDASLQISLGGDINMEAAVASPVTTIKQVQFLINGVPLPAVTSAPFKTTFTPTVAGPYQIVAQVTDSVGNVQNSSPKTVTVVAGNTPDIALSSPTADATITTDSALLLGADAAAGVAPLSHVDFYANGSVVSSKTSWPYTYVWQPPQKGTYVLRAVGYDTAGNVISSAGHVITVVSNPYAAATSYTQLTTTPQSGATLPVGVNLTMTATTTASPSAAGFGLDYYVNGALANTQTTPPYKYTGNPAYAGPLEIYAVARGNGFSYVSAPAHFTVVPNAPPQVSITSPSTGLTVLSGQTQKIQVTATDSDDSISYVRVLVNGQVLATDNDYPYTADWTPTAEGVYTITAVARDGLGSVDVGTEVTSAPVYVRVVGAQNQSVSKVYTGPWNGVGDTGRFDLLVTNGTATFVGYSSSTGKSYYFSGMPVDSSGNFSGSDSSGNTISGNVIDISMMATLNGKTLLIGTQSTGPVTAVGQYAGTIAGYPNSSISAFVGSDGSFAGFVTDGTHNDTIMGTIGANGVVKGVGTPSLTSPTSGATYTLKIDPQSGFLSGAISGGSMPGSVTAALQTGGQFSDGSLRNLSTRGQVGTGANVLTAGFVVAGDTPKNVLIRAIGPTLSAYGITGTLADPQLQLYKVSTQIASNDNWGGNAAIASAAAKVGAFALNSASKDAALLVQLAPGGYSAQVVGVGGTTGIAMVEIYDMDAVAPFSSQKVMNVSSSGMVGTDQAQLIAGFVVSGNISKKVLIRAVGPTLAAFGIQTGALADPMLRLSHFVNGVDTTVRENNNWSEGNDPALVSDATSKAGTFPLPSGSKDSAILITLPPGTYTAQATGVNGTTGIALIEVYEIP